MSINKEKLSLSQINETYGESFCVKPFTEICNSAANSVKLCCESEVFINKKQKKNQSLAEIFYNDSRMSDVRNKMLAGEKIPECKRCYFKEKTTGTSMRVESLNSMKRFNTELFKKVINGHVEISTMDVKFGNKCNLACVMCDPGSSSLIALDRKKNGFDPILKEDWEVPEVIDYDFPASEFDKLKSYASTIRSFAAKGGEPTLLPYYRDWIEFLVENNHSKNINFFTVSNGTVDLSEMIENFKKFNLYELCWSVDGIGKSFNYLRWPANFEKVSRNHSKMIQKVIDHNCQDTIKFGFSTVAHALNIDQMIPTAKYAESLSLIDNISYHAVHSVDAMSTGLITENNLEKFKQQVDDYCNTDGKYKNNLLNLYKIIEKTHYLVRKDSNNFQNLLIRLKAMTDHWKIHRNLNVEEYCPSYTDTISQLK